MNAPGAGPRAADGPAAHGPLADRKARPPRDLADGSPVDDPSVVTDDASDDSDDRPLAATSPRDARVDEPRDGIGPDDDDVVVDPPDAADLEGDPEDPD